MRQLTNNIVLKYIMTCYLRYHQKNLTKISNKILSVLTFDELMGKVLILNIKKYSAVKLLIANK